MTPVTGEQVDLYIFRDSSWVPFACAVSVGFRITEEMIPIATVDSGTNEDFEIGFEGMEVSLEGVTTFDEYSKYQLLEFIANRRIKQQIRIEFVDSIGNTYTLTMWVRTSEIGVNNSVDDFSMYDITLVRCGAMTTELNGEPTVMGIGSMVIGSSFIVG